MKKYEVQQKKGRLKFFLVLRLLLLRVEKTKSI